MREIDDPVDLREIDRPYFDRWLTAGLVRPCSGGYRITAAGEKVFWSMFEPGARACEVASFLDQNLLGILSSLEEGKSLSEVVSMFEFASNDGFILTSSDLEEALLRWQRFTPTWVSSKANEAAKKVLNALAAPQ